MRLWRQIARDLIQVMLHRLRVGARHDHGRPGAALGADRAKQIGRFGAQVGERSRSGTASRPAPGTRVLLAAPHFVLKPDFTGVFAARLATISSTCSAKFMEWPAPHCRPRRLLSCIGEGRDSWRSKWRFWGSIWARTAAVWLDWTRPERW